MGLVDDNGVVTAQQAVALYFRQQDAIGHQLQIALAADTWSVKRTW